MVLSLFENRVGKEIGFFVIEFCAATRQKIRFLKGGKYFEHLFMIELFLD